MLSIKVSIYCLIICCIFSSVYGRHKSRQRDETSKEPRQKHNYQKTKTGALSHNSKSKLKASQEDRVKQPSDDEIVEQLKEKWSTYAYIQKSGKGSQSGHSSNAEPNNSEILKALETHGIDYQLPDKKGKKSKGTSNADLLSGLKKDRIKVVLPSASAKDSLKKSKEQDSRETSHSTTESSNPKEHETQPSNTELVDELRKQVKRKLKNYEKRSGKMRSRGFGSRKSSKSNQEENQQGGDEEMRDYLAKHFGSSKDTYRKWDDTLATHQNGPNKPKPIWDD